MEVKPAPLNDHQGKEVEAHGVIMRFPTLPKKKNILAIPHRYQSPWPFAAGVAGVPPGGAIAAPLIQFGDMVSEPRESRRRGGTGCQAVRAGRSRQPLIAPGLFLF